MPASTERHRHDEIDVPLLALLRQNSRAPVSELATALGVSRSAVYAGIARLEQDGTIDGYTVRLGAEHARRMVRAHVMIKAAPKVTQQTQDALALMPELTALHAVAGEDDLIAMIEAPGLERLNALLDAIGMLEGVEKTRSSIILATKLQR